MYRKKCHIGKVKIVDFDIYSTIGRLQFDFTYLAYCS